MQAATDAGVSFNFNPKCVELKSSGGTIFNIEKKGRLYFLNSSTSCKSSAHTIHKCHKILGHCNVKYILKIENIVEGMEITNKDNFECHTCIEGKMSQYRSREPDKRATSPLEFVHCDLAGPISPVAKVVSNML